MTRQVAGRFTLRSQPGAWSGDRARWILSVGSGATSATVPRQRGKPAKRRADMSGPLSGIKVAEFSAAMASPYCGMMPADDDAEVIKIEPVGVGDDSRAWPPHFHGTLDVPGAGPIR